MGKAGKKQAARAEALAKGPSVTDQKAEEAFGRMVMREALRGDLPRKHDWASQAWRNVQRELKDMDGHTAAAMEVAETIEHTRISMETILAQVALVKETVNKSLEEVETYAGAVLKEIEQDRIGDIRLWPALKALTKVVGAMRANEATLGSAIESAFTSFYESAQAIKRVQEAQKKADAALKKELDQTVNPFHEGPYR